jgi:hypothetical protein
VRLTLIGLGLFLGVTAGAGAVAVLPTLPPAWLVGTPFPDDTLPALALAVVVGGGALVGAALVLLGRDLGVVSLLVGLAIVIFEVVETLVVGLDVWLRALGLRPALGPVGASFITIDGIPTPLGVSAPLWLQPFYVVLGVAIMALSLRLRARRSPAKLHVHPVAR